MAAGPAVDGTSGQVQASRPARNPLQGSLERNQMSNATEIFESAKERVVSVAGGPARLQIIAVLAAVLAVESCDLGTVSAVSGELKGAFHLGNTDVGLLLAVVSFVGAAATLPMGALVDRVSRRVLLMIVVATWV